LRIPLSRCEPRALPPTLLGREQHTGKFNMIRAVTFALLACSFARADGPTIHNFDDAKVRTADKAKAETVEGKVGKALKMSFADEGRNAFVMTDIRGKPEWDKAAGFSFWVKGDGSKRFGGVQLIWNGDFSARYDFMFPIDGTDWRQVTVRWSDLTPVLPGAEFLGSDGPAPAKFSSLWFGKWWYWRDYAAHSYTLDELRLEPVIEPPATDFKPAGAPLQRVLDKLKAGKPIRIVTMGDSLTDYAHWANKPVNWPTALAKLIKTKYGCDVTIENPAIGGTQLRQGLVLLPRWVDKVPEPDLVTVAYGYNDWDSGMRGPAFEKTYKVAIDRIRRTTGGKADVLIHTALPAVDRWTTMAELAQACRAAAADRNAALADTEKAFHEAGKTDREKLYCRDKVHLGPVGHELIAQTVLETIERAGKR